MDALQELLGWLASQEDSADTDALTLKLANAYQADGAGLAGPFPAALPPVVQAWNTDPDPGYPWLGEFVKPTTTQVMEKPGRTWLVAPLEGPLGSGTIAWIATTPGRTFSDTEKRMLAAAGLLLWQALERTQPGHPWLIAVRQSRCSEQLEQAARLTGKLAHDFGNLLTGTLGFAELALSQVSPPSIVHQFLSEVVQSARQGATWVHKLQAFSRRMTPEPQTSDFAGVLAEEEARIRHAWQDFATLTIRIPPRLPPVEMEAAALQTVLAHVLNNAREALTEPGAVTLTAREVQLDRPADFLGRPRPGRYLEVTVTDTGKGLPDLLMQGRIDEVFIRTRNRYRGLGLAVVYGILTNYAGGIAFLPPTGKGAGVRLVLPLSEVLPVSPAKERTRGKTFAEPTSGEKVK